MTRDIPAHLRRVCASAARKSTVTVRCPRLIPAGYRDASVLAPRRSVVRPGARGDDGVRRYRGPRDYYVIEAYARSLPEGHWITGAGNASTVDARALVSSRPPRIRHWRVAGRDIELRSYPPYPDGGVNGGHVVALVRDRGQLVFVSVHGRDHFDVAAAMLLDLIAAS